MISDRAKHNAVRSMVVVIGSLAFGYLTLRLGAKPFLDKAEEFERSIHSQSRSSSSIVEQRLEDDDASSRRL